MGNTRKIRTCLCFTTVMLLFAAGPAHAVLIIGPPGSATPTTGTADNVVATGASLHGTVDSPDVPFSYYFEYGTTTAYGGSTAITDYPTSGAGVAVSAAVTGLTAGTTYHFRLDTFLTGTPYSGSRLGAFAGTPVNVLNGADMTFTTPADAAIAPPNLSPVAQIISWPAARHGASTATYVLDGSTSYDGDGTVVAFSWLKASRVIGSGATTQQKLPVGKTTSFTLIVTDDAGATAQAKVSVKPPKGKSLKPIHIRMQAETLFLFDHFDLTSGANTRLTAIVKRLHALGVKRIKVDGHTDALGTDAYNQKLSEQRAATVGNLLRTKLHLAANTVKERGYGESRPVAANTNADGSDNPDGRAKNRRVELTAYFK